MVIAAEQKKVLGERVAILNERIVGFEGIVKALQDKDTATVGSYEREIALMKDQRKIFETAIADKEKEIKRLKRKMIFRTAGGVMITGVLVYLYITK